MDKRWLPMGKGRGPPLLAILVWFYAAGPAGRAFSRTDLARHLDAHRIGNRMLFGGNLLRQPAFVQLRLERPEAMRALGETPGAERIMNESIFVGVYPGLNRAMRDYMIETISAFCQLSQRQAAVVPS